MLRQSKYILTVPLSGNDYLFVNTFTGDMISGGEDLLKVFKGDLTSCHEKVLSDLVSSGFLTELTPKEETASVFEALQSLQNVYKGHTLFLFILTYNCNMRCSYCFESFLFEREVSWLKKRMSFNQVDAAFDAMEKIAPEESIPVHLFGGEPFLFHNHDLVEYVLKKGTDLGKSFSAITNGLETYKFIPLLKKANIKTLQITVDGIKKVHDTRKKRCDNAGTFHQIVHSIDQLVEAGIHVTVKVTFDHSTVKELPHFMEFAKKKGWIGTHIDMYASPVFHHTKGGCYNVMSNLCFTDLDSIVKDNLVRTAFLQGMHPLAQKLGFTHTWVPQISYCRHMPSQLYFDPFGHMYVCDDSLGDTEHAVGIYYPELHFNEQYHTWEKRTIFHMKSCHHCKYALICGGGCGHYTYHEKGSIVKPDCTFSQQARTMYYPLLWKMIQQFGKKQLVTRVM